MGKELQQSHNHLVPSSAITNINPFNAHSSLRLNTSNLHPSGIKSRSKCRKGSLPNTMTANNAGRSHMGPPLSQ